LQFGPCILLWWVTDQQMHHSFNVLVLNILLHVSALQNAIITEASMNMLRWCPMSWKAEKDGSCILIDGVMVGILLGEGSQCEKRVVLRTQPAFHIGILHPVISQTLRRLSQYTAPIVLCFSRYWAPSQHVHIGLRDYGILKCRNM
jgi:hypothetical protein